MNKHSLHLQITLPILKRHTRELELVDEQSCCIGKRLYHRQIKVANQCAILSSEAVVTYVLRSYEMLVSHR